MKKAAIVTIFIVITLCTVKQNAFCQNAQLTNFWKEVKLRNDTKNMNGGVAAWLYEIAQSISNGSYSEAQAHLETIDKDKAMQDAVFYKLYVSYQGNVETMRTILASMCSGYTLANPVSNYIIATYSNNPAAQNAIAENKKQAEIQRIKEERIEKEKEVAEEKQAAILRQQARYRTINTIAIFYTNADYNSKIIDSLGRGEIVKSIKDSAGFIYVQHKFKMYGETSSGWFSKIDFIHTEINDSNKLALEEITGKKYSGKYKENLFELTITHIEKEILATRGLVSGFIKINGQQTLVNGMYDYVTKEFKFWRINDSDNMPIDVFVGILNTIDKTLNGICYSADKKANSPFSLKVEDKQKDNARYEPIPITEYLPKYYKIPSDNEYEGNWKKIRKTTPIPWHIEADFNGDGLKDHAYLLHHDVPSVLDNNHTIKQGAFIVFIAQPNGTWVTQVYKDEGSLDINECSLEYENAILIFNRGKMATNYYWDLQSKYFKEKTGE